MQLSKKTALVAILCNLELGKDHLNPRHLRNLHISRILSVSYDPTLLATRRLLLQTRGYEVTSAEGFAEAIEVCNRNHFDLVIMGHSIPQKDKRAIVAELRKHGCEAPVLSLLRVNETPIPEATHGVDPRNPQEMLDVVESIVSANRN